MSETLATYGFLPWLRRGMASEITRVDGPMTGAQRADVPITLRLKAAGGFRDVTVPIALHGPGEVAAIDRRVVIRTNPHAGENDAEPNYFPAIEFDQPDFPWCYTPARADAQSRLRPWIVLAVLTADEVSGESPPGEGRLPALTVVNAAALPRLSQSWAWAHIQIEGFNGAPERVSELIRQQPHRARSRLLAPRRLLPNTAYRAVLVPAFERGRLAGLQQPLGDTDALQPAWLPNAVDIRLPVYYEWSFQTGIKGDFEFLARKLRARPVDDGVGRIEMDVRKPDPALPAASSQSLAYEGALVSPRMGSTPWPGSERAPFVAALATMLNGPADALAAAGGGATVAPPLWGRWHAARSRLVDGTAARPVWFHELNADPRHRVAAGLGAEIVRQNDQQLMAAAWDQVEGVIEANAELRRAQLAREAAARLHRKHYAQFDADSFLAVTAPLHGRFMAKSFTVREVLCRSPIPAGAFDGQFRRVRRPGGPVAKRIKRLGAAPRSSLFERLNSGALRSRPPLAVPKGMMSPDKVKLDKGTPPSKQAVIVGTAKPEVIRSANPRNSYVPSISTRESGQQPIAPRGIEPGSSRALAAVKAFRDAYADLAAELNTPLLPGPVWVPADLADIVKDVMSDMDPRVTIPAGIRHRLAIADWVTWRYDDPLEPVMAAPEFDTPMYEPLRDYGQSWLMPGVGRIPPDTVTLAVSNQRFIEAYMAGLSHEMARELLYHEYPTDQRGTYFRQFWDVRAAMGPGGAELDPANLLDIKRIHEWRRDHGLGHNSGRVPQPRDGHLVFVIKGDLLRRYPSTLVYAVKTTLDGGRRTLGAEEKFPVFGGRLDPDILFFGFDLLPDEVHGHLDPIKDQGWYFVLQEQPTEPLFGLDVDDGGYAAQPVSWNDLGWAHLAANGEALAALNYIDLNANLPDTSMVVAGAGEPPLAWHAENGQPAGANSSDLAYITLQRPFRVAIHGSDMLPEPPR